MKVKKAAPKTLTDFVKGKVRAACAVCSLPDAVLAQLRAARDKGIPRRTIRAWLLEEYGKSPIESEFTTHANGHHED